MLRFVHARDQRYLLLLISEKRTKPLYTRPRFQTIRVHRPICLIPAPTHARYCKIAVSRTDQARFVGFGILE